MPSDWCLSFPSTHAKKVNANNTPFYARSVVGDIEIKEHTKLRLFDHEMSFFLMPSLKTYDGILGNDTLKDLEVVNYTNKNYLILRKGIKIRLKQLPSKAVNTINIKEKYLLAEQKLSMKKIAATYSSLFSEPNEKLTYTTKLFKKQIRTT